MFPLNLPPSTKTKTKTKQKKHKPVDTAAPQYPSEQALDAAGPGDSISALGLACEVVEGNGACQYLAHSAGRFGERSHDWYVRMRACRRLLTNWRDYIEMISATAPVVASERFDDFEEFVAVHSHRVTYGNGVTLKATADALNDLTYVFCVTVDEPDIIQHVYKMIPSDDAGADGQPRRIVCVRFFLDGVHYDALLPTSGQVRWLGKAF